MNLSAPFICQVPPFRAVIEKTLPLCRGTFLGEVESVGDVTMGTPVLEEYTPQKSTWNLEMMVSNRNLLFQGSIFRFHVCFGGCMSGWSLEKATCL